MSAPEPREGRCSISGWGGIETEHHHIGAEVNVPTTTIAVRGDLHLDLQRRLLDAGVVHSHDHEPSTSEVLFAVTRGTIDCYAAVISAAGGSRELTRSLELVAAGLGRVLAAGDGQGLGPRPLEAAAFAARRKRLRRDGRRTRFCWGCGRRLTGGRRKWCERCARDPDRRQGAHDRVAANAGATPVTADRLTLLLSVCTGLSQDFAGFVEPWVLSWLSELGEIARGLVERRPLFDGYGRQVELATAAVSVAPIVATYATELVAQTVNRRPRARDVLRFIDAVERFDELAMRTIEFLSTLARCETKAAAHGVLDAALSVLTADQAGWWR